MTPSAPAPTTTPRGPHRFAWLQTWLLPPLLGALVLCIYIFTIVPVKSRPWYVPPRPKPGKSIVFRSLNRSAEAIDKAALKAEREARLAKSRAAREKTKKDREERKNRKDPKGAKNPKNPKSPKNPKNPKNPDTASGRAAGLPAANKVRAFITARPKSVLDSLEQRYGALPLSDEPVDESWASAHKALHFQLFALTRDRVFDGAPDTPSLSLREVRCHSLRCELVLATPYAHELHLITEALASLRWHRRSLWRSFVRADLQGKTATRKTFELHLVVTFAADLIALHDIQYDGDDLTQKNPMSPTGTTHR